ncbi:MAG TPA: DUF4153 domain-containing protein, partial [Allosphingosinicella sp.]|nr:DUF4153 domain-containing protein [Allosphingosinicella sp.]
GAGLVIGGIYYWNGTPDEHGTGDDILRFFASLLSVAIAAPLFQTMRDEGARRLPYVAVHAHSWTNVVLWCATWAFVLVSFLLVLLLGELFGLIGIDLLKDAIEKSWFDWMLVGGAFGAAVGLLRDRDKVLGLLQRVVTTVLSVLAPVLAIGLVLFVIALPFTGLDVLWDKTRSPTPVVLACVAGAIILANAVIGNASAEEARGPVLRGSGMALGAVLVPLVAVAAISTGLRIGQYGFTPSRLWGVVAVTIAAAYALSYLYALVRGHTEWAARVRPANVKLAIGVCIVGLLLATPLAQFGAISARSQVARLEAGKVTPGRFDWRALRFEFGPSGVAALERLRANGATAEIRRLAQTALDTRNSWDLPDNSQNEGEVYPAAILVDPAGTPVPPALLRAVQDDYDTRSCGRRGDCRFYFRPAEHAVIVIADECTALRRRAETDRAALGQCNYDTIVYVEQNGRWDRADRRAVAIGPALTPEQERASLTRESDALRRGEVEIRRVERRQLFVGGRPVKEPFD